MTRPVVESTLFRARRKLSEEYDELVSGRRCEQVQALIATEEKQSLMKLGIRQRRQLARHLSHCQPCRRAARIAELDESLFHAPGIAGKIAALLPFPWLWRRRPGGDRSSSVASNSHSLSSLPGFQTIAQVATIVAPSTGFGRAAAAAAGLAAAGVGGGVVVVNNSGPHRAPASTSSVVSRTPRHATLATGASRNRGPGHAAGNRKSAAPVRTAIAAVRDGHRRRRRHRADRSARRERCAPRRRCRPRLPPVQAGTRRRVAPMAGHPATAPRR